MHHFRTHVRLHAACFSRSTPWTRIPPQQNYSVYVALSLLVPGSVDADCINPFSAFALALGAAVSAVLLKLPAPCGRTCLLQHATFCALLPHLARTGLHLPTPYTLARLRAGPRTLPSDILGVPTTTTAAPTAGATPAAFPTFPHTRDICCALVALERTCHRRLPLPSPPWHSKHSITRPTCIPTNTSTLLHGATELCAAHGSSRAYLTPLTPAVAHMQLLTIAAL